MAEINFNNLYNQLSPMDKMFYDRQFQKSYNPNQENIMLSSQNAYEQMKSVYDAQQQVPEKSFFDSLNPFTSASAAEMPPVPNVSLGTPQINFNTGITSASNAIPNINGVPIINTGALNQDLQNTDLVNQLIQQNQMKTNMFLRPNMMNVAGTSLPGGITPGEITEVAPLQDLGFNTSYGVANTPNVIGQQSGVDVYETDDGRAYYIDPVTGKEILAPDTVEAYKKQSGYSGQKPSGIAKLFEFLGKLPTPFNLARRGLDSLTGINNRMQNSMFGKSKTLAEYFNNRKIAKATGSKDFMNRPRSERNYTGPSGGNNTGGDRGAKGAADSFSNKSGMGRTGY